MKNSKKSNTMIYFMYVIYLILFLIINQLYDSGNSVANIKYYILSFLLFISFLILFNKKKKQKKEIYSKENLLCIVVAIIFIIISYFKSKSAGYSMSYRTFVQITQFVFPTLLAFSFVNIFSLDSIIKIMKTTLMILVIAYFFESKHTITQFLNINNWMNIDLLNSQSFTESHNYAESFLQLFLFFNYLVKCYYKDSINSKKYKKYYYLSFIFTLLSFKRLGFLFAIFIFFIGNTINYEKKYSKTIIIILSLLFTYLTIFYTNLLKGNINVDINLTKFTSNRNWFMELWKAHGYLSYGYGTSLFVIGRYLEMDLVEIYMELNSIALFSFIFSFFKMTKANQYLLLIMCYVFLNLITSSTLPWIIGWITLMINIVFISRANQMKFEKTILIN